MAQTALITGASGGLGLEFAKLFAKDGHNVVLVARSQSKLEQLAREIATKNVKADIIVKDLASPDAPLEIVEELTRRHLQIDFLVNNAGVGMMGPFASASPEEQVKLLQLNITSLVHLTRLLLPGMIQRKSGRILNVASTAAFQPGPLMAVYYASKAFVLSFSLAVQKELKGTGVTVTALCPGPTKTGFSEAAGMTNSKLFNSPMVTPAYPVALKGYRAMHWGCSMVIAGLMNKILVFATRFAPRGLTASIAHRLNKAVG